MKFDEVDSSPIRASVDNFLARDVRDFLPMGEGGAPNKEAVNAPLPNVFFLLGSFTNLKYYIKDSKAATIHDRIPLDENLAAKGESMER